MCHVWAIRFPIITMQVLHSLVKSKTASGDLLTEACHRADQILDYYAMKKQFANALVGVGKRQMKAHDEAAPSAPQEP